MACAKYWSSNSTSYTTPEGVTIRLKTGSITDEQVDIIINTVQPNSGLISKAISSAAGSDLHSECRKVAPHGIDIGDCIQTSGGNLSCQQIYHCAVSKWNNGNGKQGLRLLLQLLLVSASSDDRKSMAMSALGTDEGFPNDYSAKIIFEEIIKFSSQHDDTSLKDIVIVINELGTQRIQMAFQLCIDTLLEAPKITSPVEITTKEGLRVTVKEGSITQENVHVIVNSTRSNLQLDRGAISKSILRAAGDRIQHECNQKAPNGVRGSEIVVTSGGKLRARSIYHGSVPSWPSVGSDQHLRQFIRNCLERANKSNMKSIAIPGIGTGALRYPAETVAEIFRDEIEEFSKTHTRTVTDVRIVIFDNETFQVIGKWFSDTCDMDKPGSPIIVSPVPSVRIGSAESIKDVNKTDYRHNWEKMDQTEDYGLVQLSPSRPEFKQVADKFLATANRCKIEKIERVQCTQLLDVYVVRKSHIENNIHSGVATTERRLYHGTDNATVEKICRHGLSRTFCSTKIMQYGNGVYFAKNASTVISKSWSPASSDGRRQMFQCTVVTGQFTKGDSTMVSPPQIDPPKPQLYDSVVDDINNPSIFVVFHDAQAYPEYLITFK